MASIHQLMPLAAAEVGAISKDKQTTGSSSFAFRGIDDLMNALHPILAEHGITIAPAYRFLERYDRSTRSGGIMEFVIIEGTFSFSGPDGDEILVKTIGQASDTADKAINKAMSAALKYALIQTFTVPTADISDSDADSIEMGQPLPPIDLDAVRDYLAGATEEQVQKVLGNLAGYLHQGRLSPESAAKIEEWGEARRDVLENEATMTNQEQSE